MTGTADPGNRRLSPEAAYRALAGEPRWIVERDRIYRDFRFDTFREAIGFVNRVADAAEAADHHPNIEIHEYHFVRITLYSHLAGGVVQKDVDLARRISALAPAEA